MRLFVFVLLYVSIIGNAFAQKQDPLRFSDEVRKLLAADSAINPRKVVLFTGSSSIRLWSSLKNDFPKHNTINHGFGGSTMYDLLHYTDDVILSNNPKKIFIYEGDNDIAANVHPDSIIADAERIVNKVRSKLGTSVKIVFISPKPSIVRLEMKDKYVVFNQRLKSWTQGQPNVFFADVWHAMMDDKGELRRDLFISDNLHMNSKGYEIWRKVIRKFL